MSLKFKQVDAFTDIPFKGNPAAVFLHEGTLNDLIMQSIAAEMNLSETAFLEKRGNTEFNIRWFTPTTEVDLCGHATLASAHVLWEDEIMGDNQLLTFYSKSGPLHAEKRDNWIQLDFPLEPEVQILGYELKKHLEKALQTKIIYAGQNRLDILAEVSEECLFRIEPQFESLSQLGSRGVIITSPSSNPAYDFISRCFYPRVGVNEDPVTGSAHCFLADYWHKKFRKNKLCAYQASQRGGFLKLEILQKRVLILGQAITTVSGSLLI